MALEIKNFDKMIEMGRRIYNNKPMEEKEADGAVKYSDDAAIKALCSKVFGKDGDINSMEDLRSFNKLIVEVANTEVQARFEQIINAVADYKAVGRYDQMVYYKVPTRTQTTMHLAASGSGVDFTKIPSRQSKVPAVPYVHQFGVQYSISDMVNDPINAFKGAVNFVVESKIKYIFKQIMKLAKDGLAAGKIPSKQHFDGSNITLAAFRGIENQLLRAGGNVRPTLIADTNFINQLALKQGTEGLGVSTNFAWLTDELRTSLLRDITFDTISRSFAISLDNPFIDEKNDKVDLDVQEAIMLAGGEGAPFKITEYGATRTAQDMPSIEKEEVIFKVDMKVNISLLLGSQIAYLKDDAIAL
jgi:hypothetical protein